MAFNANFDFLINLNQIEGYFKDLTARLCKNDKKIIVKYIFHSQKKWGHFKSTITNHAKIDLTSEAQYKQRKYLH